VRKGLARERAGGEGIGGVSDGARGSKGRERERTEGRKGSEKRESASGRRTKYGDD